MIFTASTFPQLFETLILVDPTIFPADTVRWPATSTLVNGAIIRRTQWKSREEAKTLFAKNKSFYGRWHKDVLDGYVHYGLLEDEQGMQLKVDRMQEAVSSVLPALWHPADKSAIRSTSMQMSITTARNGLSIV